MPKENFKKEQELLRLLWLEGGGYHRRELASVLGLSADSVDRSLREIRSVLEDETILANAWPEKKETYYFFTHQQADANPLACLYSLRSLRESELERYLAIISILSEQPSSFQELLNEICHLSNVNEEDQHAYKKTLVSYLAALRRAGFIHRQPSQRGKYYLPSSLVDLLSPSELASLGDFVAYCAHTTILSALGWQLLGQLQHWLSKHTSRSTVFHYRHACFSRILDEHLVYELQRFCQRQTLLTISHYPRQQPLRYTPAKVAKRSKLRSKNPRTSRLFPLKLVYDRSYARWYFWGKNLETHRLEAIRLDTIQAAAPLPQFKPATEILGKTQQDEDSFHICWLSPGETPITIKARFFAEEGVPLQVLKNRISQSSPLGHILEETASGLTWSCTISDPRAIKPWLRSFGSCLEVLEPEELRQEIAAEWKRLVNQYA